MPQALRHRRLVLPPEGDSSPRKSPQNAPGGCGPRSPVRPRGVHPKKRHLPGSYAPPGHPIPYCLPLPGFAQASIICRSLQLKGFALRPHPLPRNTGRQLHAVVFSATSGFAVGARIGGRAVAATARKSPDKRADVGIGPYRVTPPALRAVAPVQKRGRGGAVSSYRRN